MKDKSVTRSYSTPKTQYGVDLYLNSNEGFILNEGDPLISRYPNTSVLEQRIADYIGVDSKKVILTAGGDDAIERLIRTALDANKEAIIPVPTFDMINIYSQRTGAKLIQLKWLNDEYPTDQVIDNINIKTGLICIVSPNNPTGLCITKNDLIKIVTAASNSIVMVDLAYTEFAEEDLTSIALEFDNVVVIRTFSKAWGLAGLRIGYAVGSQKIIQQMKGIGLPYPVSYVSMQIVEMNLEKNIAQMLSFVLKVKEQRIALQKVFDELNIEYFKSGANFVLAKFNNAEQFFNSLASMGLLVRKFPDTELIKDYLRITIPGTDVGFSRLINSLKTILKPEAILFDLDNTLADTSTSYDESIIATCKTYNVDTDKNKIAETRNMFGLNNDWELTFKILQDLGVSTNLKEVTRRFEGFYQGTNGNDGFKRSEELIIDINVLKRLSAKFKLGIITGRPRKDAICFLENKNILKYFGSVVTMDDAEQKPSSQPASLSLKNLNAKTAWMIGDNPDDIKCAKAAGLLAIGVTRTALYSFGAAVVLENINKIEEIIQ